MLFSGLNGRIIRPANCPVLVGGHTGEKKKVMFTVARCRFHDVLRGSLEIPSRPRGELALRSFTAVLHTVGKIVFPECFNTYRRKHREITTRRDRHKKQQKVC